MPDIEQVQLKSTRPEPLLTPLNARLRLPRPIPERSPLRPPLIASLQRLLMAPFLAKVRPTLLAAFRVRP